MCDFLWGKAGKNKDEIMIFPDIVFGKAFRNH